MNITQIESVVLTTAKGFGYTPLLCEAATLSRDIKKLPTAWLTHPKVLYVEGREQGVIAHKIALTLIEKSGGKNAEDKVKALLKMEEDLLSIFSSISLMEGIVEIDSLTITPSLSTLSMHGDISQSAAATIVTYF